MRSKKEFTVPIEAAKELGVSPKDTLTMRQVTNRLRNKSRTRNQDDDRTNRKAIAMKRRTRRHKINSLKVAVARTLMKVALPQ